MFYKLRDIDPEIFKAACNSSSSFADICRNLNMAVTSTAYPRIREKAKRLGICLDHIKQGLDSNKGRKFFGTRSSVEQALKSSNRQWIKKVLLREGVLENKCSICGMSPTWSGKYLVFRLDHINGIRDDNKLSNLRLVCPNCDSQLSTFSGRNNKKMRE